MQRGIRRRLQRARGFTLPELAISVTIIALLLAAILNLDRLVGGARSTSVQATVKDLNVAINQFRSTYGYLPGDMPDATTRIPGVAANSCSLTANGNGNGQIDAGEVACVPLHLSQAGLIKGGTGAITILSQSGNISVRAISRTAGTVTSFPSSTRNVIELLNVPCDIAQDLDNKSDDGNFATGTTRASVASCVAKGPSNAAGVNDPVPAIAVAF